jgi:hypothetical protein
MLLAGAVVLLVSCGRDTATGPLTPSVATGDVPSETGYLELTFTADESCTALPEIARSRTYATPSGLLSSSRRGLTGATFGRSSAQTYSWNVIYQRPFDHSVEWWFSDPPIWELVDSEAYVTIYGGPTLVGVEGGSDVKTGEWPFWGRFTYCAEMEPDDYPECEVPVATCESEHHRLRVARR